MPGRHGKFCLQPAGVVDSRWTTGSTATLDSGQMNYLPLNVPLHLFVDSARNDASGSGPYTIRIQDVTIAPAARVPIRLTALNSSSTNTTSTFSTASRTHPARVSGPATLPNAAIRRGALPHKQKQNA